MKIRFLIFEIFALLTLLNLASAQKIKNLGNLFFITNYSPEDYSDARQNWCAIQDKRGLMYFANGSGNILEFDGNNWNKIPVSKTTVRSLALAENNTIYVGAKNELGFLKKTSNGSLEFVSLKNKLPEKYRNFGNVWNVSVLSDSIVIYQTYSNLFLFKKDTFKIFNIDEMYDSAKTIFFKTFVLDNKFYVFVKKIGLFVLKNDTLNFVKNSDVFAYVNDKKKTVDIVRSIIKIKGKIYVITHYQGVFLWKNGLFQKIHTPIDSVIIQNIYNAYVIDNKYIALALYPTGGLLITDQNFNIIQFVSQDNGLRNDKIYNFYLDNQKNLWLCLDNGLASIFLYTSLTKFGRDYNFSKEAKVYDFLIFDSVLYIATSNGILYRNWFQKEIKLDAQNFSPSLYQKDPKYFTSQKSFNYIDDAQGLGTNYKLTVTDNKIWFVSIFGLGYVQNKKAKYVIRQKGFRFLFVPDSQNIIAASGAIFILKKNKLTGNWYEAKKYEKIKLPTGEKIPVKDIRTIAKDDQGYFWFASDANGIFKIKFSPNFDTILYAQYYSDKYGLYGLPSQVHNKVAYFDKLYVTTEKGVFYFDKKTQKFKPVEFINNLLNGEYFVNMIYKDKQGNFWIKYNEKINRQNNWLLAKIYKENNQWKINKFIFAPLKNRMFSFAQLSDNEYVVGTDEGFVHYSPSIKEFDSNFKCYIRKVSIINTDSVIFAGYKNPNAPKIQLIEYKYRNLRFLYGANYFKTKGTQFSCFLQGYDKTWHLWTTENAKEYSNLPPGAYVFKVKAKNIFGKESSVVQYSFIILPPWYRTKFAYFVYFLLSGAFIWLIVYLYTLRLKKQKEHLEQLVKERTKEIEKQKDILQKQNIEIQRKNKDITSSIEYAKRIQTAILPLDENIRKYLPEHFILFKPRDIVSGDFYWFAHKNGKSIIAAVDCTGHGVPGAFMSILGVETLNSIVLNKGITDPAEILNLQHKYIKHALKQKYTDTKDGMDMALCVIDKENNIVEFAGAKNPLVFIKNEKIKEIKGDRQGIAEETDFPYKKHTVKIDEPTVFYIFSDGYKDQFGGKEYRKFLKKFFYELLLKIHKLPFDQQKQILDKTIEDWKNGYKQTDDILVIGFKINPKK